MEHFSEEHSKVLLGKEWLVKIDTQSSTAYLIKFNSSTVNLSCCMLVTDTKTTWAEVLSSKQFARRWRDCNQLSETLFAANNEEESWRKRNLELLSTAHTLGGVKDLDFATVESRYGDFAFQLECEFFRWRWEAVSLGHKVSAEILSKHLIMPLISVNHLAFSSADPVCELSEADLEKAVDKMGRTARRTVDTHVKHAVSKPRVATTIQRMTALLNFMPDLPAIISTSEPPKFQVEPEAQPPRVSAERPRSKPRSISPPSVPIHPHAMPATGTSLSGSANAVKSLADSATESESEGLPSIPGKGKEKDTASPLYSIMNPNIASPAARPTTPMGTSQTKALESDSESSPARSPKKSRVAASSSDDDSEVERKRRVALLKSGAGAAKRGTKQPIKRGGKRF